MPRLKQLVEKEDSWLEEQEANNTAPGDLAAAAAAWAAGQGGAEGGAAAEAAQEGAEQEGAAANKSAAGERGGGAAGTWVGRPGGLPRRVVYSKVQGQGKKKRRPGTPPDPPQPQAQRAEGEEPEAQHIDSPWAEVRWEQGTGPFGCTCWV